MTEAVGIADALRGSGLLSPEDLARAEQCAAERAMPLDRAVVALGLLAEDQVLWFVAERVGVGLVFPSEDAVDADLVARFPADVLRRHDALPMLQDDDGSIVVAFPTPPDAELVESLSRAVGSPVHPALASAPRLRRVLARVLGSGTSDAARVGARDPSGVTTFYRHLTGAFGGGAEELRFEPGPDGLRVRYRVHGRLRDVETTPAEIAPAVVARAQMLGDFRGGSGKPEQTTLRTSIAGRTRRLTLAIVPTALGECVVLRALPQLEVPERLEDWPLPRDVAAWLADWLAAPPSDRRILRIRGEDDELRTALLRAVAARADEEGLSVAWVADGRVPVGPWVCVPQQHADEAIVAMRPDVVVSEDPRRVFGGARRVVLGVRVPHGEVADPREIGPAVDVRAEGEPCESCLGATRAGCTECRGAGYTSAKVVVSGRVANPAASSSTGGR